MDEKNESRKRLKILYIGGNKKVTKEYQDSTLLFDVIDTENGLEAINQLKKIDDLDAIISEAQLPGINGIEIFRMLRAKAIHPKTPFILLSNETNEPLKNEAIKQLVPLIIIRLPKAILNIAISILSLAIFLIELNYWLWHFLDSWLSHS